MPESCRRHHVLALTWSLTVPQALREIRHAGGDVNRPDADQRTALHQAAWEGGLVTVQALVEEFDANPSPRDKWRRTPLDEALFHEHTEVVDYLLSQGARGKVSAWRRLRAKLRRRRKPAVRGMVAAAGQEKMTRRGGGGSKDTSPDSSLHSGSSFTRRSRDGRNSKGGGSNMLQDAEPSPVRSVPTLRTVLDYTLHGLTQLGSPSVRALARPLARESCPRGACAPPASDRALSAGRLGSAARTTLATCWSHAQALGNGLGPDPPRRLTLSADSPSPRCLVLFRNGEVQTFRQTRARQMTSKGRMGESVMRSWTARMSRMYAKRMWYP